MLNSDYNNGVSVFIFNIHIMKTVIWKASIAEWKMWDFEKTYEMFKSADGFVSAEFYNLTDEESTVMVVESWESEEKQTAFMGTMSPETMNELFSLLAGKPEAWNCEAWAKIVK